MPVPDRGGNWGILGGTFDPVHRGHLNLAREVYSRKELDGVLLVPSYQHPLKDTCRASFEDRVRMLSLATAACDYLVVSEIEKEMSLPGYTLSTVKALKKRYPTAAFHFIIGEDNLGDLSRWHKPEELLAEVVILVGSRSRQKDGAFDAYSSDRIETVETNLIDVSSTALREMIGKGISAEQLDQLVLPAVRKYIEQRKLYR